jgi:predicted MPP superfamily phosphohydrolase
VNPLDADLSVIGGDMVDGSVPALAATVSPLRQLHAKDGVVFVLGNHEYLSGADSWVQHVRTFGWNVLRNESLTLPRLDVIGLDDEPPPTGIATLLMKRLSDGQRRDSGSPDSSERRATVVVAHDPTAFKQACRMGVDLALAGHTHGGQIFPLGLVDWIQSGYLAGPYRCGSTNLYVSSGAGFWGPPMRLGTQSEISLIKLLE